jgi:DNA polymerase elongation subunit (family B)
MDKPKILFWDLETTPNKGYFWDLKIPGKYLPPGSIDEERTIICGSWRWKGQKTIFSSCVDSASPKDDRLVVQQICDIVRQADAIVAHNGDDFDIRWLNGRAVFHGFAPLPPVIQIDTKKIAKKKFKLNSYTLDYMAQFFKIGKKIRTEFDLWKLCVIGDVKALARMVRYNRHDIVLLEGVYSRMAPYVPAHINLRLFTNRPVCELCGTTRIQYRGYYLAKTLRYRQWACLRAGCGHWTHARKSEKT